jgi:3-oxoacyl-(acyl-carrier-protein) synthase
MTDVFVTSIGVHTTLGYGLAANLAVLNRTPIAPQLHAVQFAGTEQPVPYFLLADAPLQNIETRFRNAINGVIDDALTQANLSAKDRHATAVFMGSSCGEMPVLEAEYRRDLLTSRDALAMASTSSLGNMANDIRARFGLQGPDYSFYTACTASANALWYAANMIRAGMLRHAVVVGVEIFNAVTALGFSGLQLLTRDVMRPFDRRRAGLVPGEACAAIVLSSEPRDRNAWRVLGGANLCDTHSISATNPDGTAIAAVIRQALDASSLTLKDIAAIKMHGTASLLNDEAESAGMKLLFDNSPPTLCALKPYLGHTFGACGVAELALFCGSVGGGQLPATPGISAGDSDLNIALNQRMTPQSPGNFMLNYFGFGGSNTSLIVSNKVVP